MLKSHFAFKNYIRAYDHQTMRVNITLCAWTSHYACEHNTIRELITLVYVEMTLVHVQIILGRVFQKKRHNDQT
jgi:hypothetical protein